MRVVIALGGNAFNQPGEPIRQDIHLKNVEAAAEVVARIAREGNQVLVTHGNGPQVGFFAELQKEINAFRLDALGAATQGLLGYFIVSAVDKRLGPGRAVAVFTRTEVDCNDPAFTNPTKYIGPSYSEAEARALAERYGWAFQQDPRGGYRRVVPSPAPLRILELGAVKVLLESGFVVVAAGGGGVPICNDAGVEAVVDKDLATSILAEQIGADLLVILTDIDAVYINFKKPNQKRLGVVKVGELEKYLLEGHFPPGSMGPKVEAAIRFVKSTGKRAAIGALEHGYDVYRGAAGTQVVP
ncbi:MAG: carbamate kinase [Pyrobaculum sp.]